LQEVYTSKKVGKYLLIFLSADDVSSDYLTKMSGSELDWLRSELNNNKKSPTIIFFHAPLKGTLSNYNEHINAENYIAQPHETLREIILGNRQIFLWVSGHTHTPATNADFNSKINVYEKQVTNIHNTDMNRETIWTNSLYLYPDKAVVKTYNHKKGVWMADMERSIVPAQK
jgi:Icc protein